MQSGLIVDGHGGRAVYFYEPGVEASVNHEIVAEQLEAILPVFDFVLHALGRGYDLSLNFGSHVLNENIAEALELFLGAVLLLNEGFELTLGPYVIKICLLCFLAVFIVFIVQTCNVVFVFVFGC